MTAAREDRELVFARGFEAPREVVFEAWTEPRHVQEWHRPRAFTNSICERDVRTGGVDQPIRIVYEEVAMSAGPGAGPNGGAGGENGR